MLSCGCKVNMPRRRVDIAISTPFRRSVSRTWLRRLALHALDTASPGRPFQVSLVLADDATVRDLNHQYRGLNETTDVLSFSVDHPGQWEGPDDVQRVSETDELFIMPREESGYLGEVVISYPQAQRQAIQAGHPLERELAMLAIHGILHLLGYDHAVSEQEAAMKALETNILDTFFARGE